MPDETQAPASTDNTFVFPIPGATNEAGEAVQISIDLAAIPAEVRMDLLKSSIRGYVTNSVNQASVRNKKALEPWAAYEAATAADALQTVVPKPEGEKPTADLITTAAEARTRLYEGKMRKQGDGKPKAVKDPLIAMVTSAVTREVFDKNKAATPGYKWTDAVKEVGGDGVAYLNAKIAERVAAGGDAKALNAYMQTKYLAPAQMMLGQKGTKATEGVELL